MDGETLVAGWYGTRQRPKFFSMLTLSLTYHILRADGALNTINQNLNEQHLQMRTELQDRHTNIVNDVNQYTTCSKFSNSSLLL